MTLPEFPKELEKCRNCWHFAYYGGEGKDIDCECRNPNHICEFIDYREIKRQ